jgi:hypothetical protein
VERNISTAGTANISTSDKEVRHIHGVSESILFRIFNRGLDYLDNNMPFIHRLSLDVVSISTSTFLAVCSLGAIALDEQPVYSVGVELHRMISRRLMLVSGRAATT